MKRPEIVRIFLSPIIELSMVFGVFLLAYQLRGITDGIPFIQLRIPYIAYERFLPFAFAGALLWGLVFAMRGLYNLRDETPIYEEIRLVIRSSFIWFIAYISLVYLTNGFLFQGEIPRLIIFYTYIISTFFSVLLRSFRYTLYGMLYRKGVLKKNTIVVIHQESDDTYNLEEDITSAYQYISLKDQSLIESLIRDQKTDGIISLIHNNDIPTIREIIELARIYGIPFFYPKFLPASEHFARRETYFGDVPVIELHAVSISAWERILKRTIDIIISGIGLIILTPLFLIISIIIKLEDPSGPVFFANRRIGQYGKEFFLYKFRYMYWKYSVKDAYGVDTDKDIALRIEESLKKKSDTRNGPLYKIANDPRKTKFGAIIERLSLDELPQLYNVLRGDMSLIGPRPHQPREVELYDEADRQVLTVKPGITGMAQVYGREKNTFKDEVRLDRHYIEHYSPFLDIIIFVRTFFVVLGRVFFK